MSKAKEEEEPVHRTSEPGEAVLGQAAAGMGEALDLQQFCGTDLLRPHLMKPFSRDGFTWATNGHILIRVPLRREIPPCDKKKFNIAAPLKGIDNAAVWARCEFILPARTLPRKCLDCDGTGKDVDDSDFSCFCCEGRGDHDSEREISTLIDKTPFSLNYVRQMLSLPDVEIAIGVVDNSDDTTKPLFFRFSGGVGALMPLRSNCGNHIELPRRH